MRKFSLHQSNGSYYGPQTEDLSLVVKQLFQMLYTLEIIVFEDVPYMYECHYFCIALGVSRNDQ